MRDAELYGPRPGSLKRGIKDLSVPLSTGTTLGHHPRLLSLDVDALGEGVVSIQPHAQTTPFFFYVSR